jgi:hypothetical protein
MKMATLLPCFKKKMYFVQFNMIKTFALVSTTEMKHLLGQGEWDYPKLLSQCCGLIRNLIPIFIRLLIKIFTKTRSTIIWKAFLDSDTYNIKGENMTSFCFRFAASSHSCDGFQRCPQNKIILGWPFVVFTLGLCWLAKLLVPVLETEKCHHIVSDSS